MSQSRMPPTRLDKETGKKAPASGSWRSHMAMAKSGEENSRGTYRPADEMRAPMTPNSDGIGKIAEAMRGAPGRGGEKPLPPTKRARGDRPG